jgi:hypothetical protein
MVFALFKYFSFSAPLLFPKILQDKVTTKDLQPAEPNLPTQKFAPRGLLYFPNFQNFSPP